MAPETKYFEHELTLSSRSEPAGAKFPARLAYWTFGDASNPAILMPTCYGGSLKDTLPFLYSADDTPSTDAAPPPLPPTKFFIIVVGLLGGGESSSPSNTPAPWSGPDFPRTTYEDNITLQHALCQHLALTRLEAYIGFSMGGQQAYHMAALHGDFATHIVALATSARTSTHNWCFLEGPRHALETADDFHGGRYGAGGAPRATRAFMRVYAPWALSQAWFRERCWRRLGFDELEPFLEENWSGHGTDANDLLAMLWTWQRGDISRCGGCEDGDLQAALGRIRSRCLIMPARTDQYFPPEDNVEEVKYLKDGEFSCIETIWGHVAGGGGGTKEDTEFIKSEVKRFLKV